MTEKMFKPGDEVFTPSARGTIVDVQPSPSGRWIFGVEDSTGEVRYFTSGALRPWSS